MYEHRYANWRALMKSWLCFELRLAGILSFLFSIFVLLQFFHYDDYAIKVQEIRATPAPDGMKYIDYCDGRPSAQLISIQQAGCIADFPMDFTIVATAALLCIFFGLASLIAFLIGFRRYRC